MTHFDSPSLWEKSNKANFTLSLGGASEGRATPYFTAGHYAAPSLFSSLFTLAGPTRAGPPNGQRQALDTSCSRVRQTGKAPV
ncbi:hypothetical protein CA85_47840 [Allorhodopirellula solitaria]|uniref:Uncharacterized protein n=1 Tax=Allorhodopirellula solitaria TaxID=2527987 RepID=A0A5C5WZ19_9BACT|nr:hypothetical protein CA85_47840 [Allorhodopirellula solitaria]